MMAEQESRLERLQSLRREHAWALALAMTLVVYSLLAVGSRFFGFDLYGDEPSFFRSSRALADPAVSWGTRVNEYDELSTPLAFALFGHVSRWTGGGIEWARSVSWLFGLVLVAVVLAVGRRRSTVLSAVAGILTHPYVLLTSVVIYSDIPAAAFCVIGVAAHHRGRVVVATIAFAIAIGIRQFSIVFPLAIIAAAWWPAVCAGVSARRRPTLPKLSSWLGPALGAASYGIWVVLLGGVTNETALEVRAVPQAQESVLGIEPTTGTYALATIGAYFVLVEVVLRRDRSILNEFRNWSPRLSVLVAISMIVAVAFPISLTGTGPVLNILERVPTAFGASVVVGVLVSLAVVRFSRGGLETWIVVGHCLLMMKSYQWDKYVMAVVVVLWLLSTLDDTDPTVSREGSPQRAADPAVHLDHQA